MSPFCKDESATHLESLISLMKKWLLTFLMLIRKPSSAHWSSYILSELPLEDMLLIRRLQMLSPSTGHLSGPGSSLPPLFMLWWRWPFSVPGTSHTPFHFRAFAPRTPASAFCMAVLFDPLASKVTALGKDFRQQVTYPAVTSFENTPLPFLRAFITAAWTPPGWGPCLSCSHHIPCA